MRALGAFCLGLCPSTALKQKVNRREKIVNTHSNDIVISFKLLPKLQADSRKSKRNNYVITRNSVSSASGNYCLSGQIIYL